MNNKKKNILVILPWLPFPFTNGGNQAMYNGIASIKDKANVVVIYFDYNRDNHKVDRDRMVQMLGNVEIIPLIIFNRNSKIKFLGWLYNKLCSTFFTGNSDYLSERMLMPFRPLPQECIDFIRNLIVQQHIEIVQMEMIPTLPIVLSLPENVKKVFVHHEIRYVFNELLLKNIGDTKYRQSNLTISKIIELGLLKRCDAIITLSQSDKEKLVKEGLSEDKVHSSIAVVNSISDGKIHIDNYNILTFVGAEKHVPNRVGIRWFLNNCWSKLLDEDKTYQLHIIGEWTDETIKEITSSYTGVKFLGYVDDLSKSIMDTIMIVPITIGSGIRMKILEAATCGIPFVSTEIGAEGLPFVDKINCFLANDPESFVEDVIKLKDINLRRRLAESSKIIVDKEYSMEALCSNRMNIYNVV